MDERIWTIAEILDKSGPMTADELAAQLKLSGKTVRSLIKTYAKEMQENGFCITAKPGSCLLYTSMPTPEGAAKQGFVKTMTEAGLL